MAESLSCFVGRKAHNSRRLRRVLGYVTNVLTGHNTNGFIGGQCACMCSRDEENLDGGLMVTYCTYFSRGLL